MNIFRSAKIGLGLLGIFCLAALPAPGQAASALVPGFADSPTRGAESAEGIVIWSHGRSLTREDSAAATPIYLRSFVAAGWDVLRFNRPRLEDNLADSTADLVRRVEQLHQTGYRRIVLAGQSYGAFLALGAAGRSADVHAVIATAPAAYGSFADSYESWQRNAEALYALLGGLHGTRVTLALFHGDDYDPGGRGVVARQMLHDQGLPALVIDQPRDLTGHLAANSALFVRRYGACLVAFAAAEADAPAAPCNTHWGLAPGPDLQIPAEASGSGTASAPANRWYGFYPNGQEFVIALQAPMAGRVEALYGTGPSLDGSIAAHWSRRHGIMTGEVISFTEPGEPRLRLEPESAEGLPVTARLAGDSMTAMAHRLATDDGHS